MTQFQLFERIFKFLNFSMETQKFEFFSKEFKIEFSLVPKSWNHISFVNISPTLVINTSMLRSSRVATSYKLQHGNPKIAWQHGNPNFASQRLHLYVVVRADSRPNGVTTTGGRPLRPHLTHLTSNTFIHLISWKSSVNFCFMLFSIVCSTGTVSMEIWLHFECLLSLCCNTSIYKYLSNISLQSNVWRCPSRIEASVSGVLIIILISPFISTVVWGNTKTWFFFKKVRIEFWLIFWLLPILCRKAEISLALSISVLY